MACPGAPRTPPASVALAAAERSRRLHHVSLSGSVRIGHRKKKPLSGCPAGAKAGITDDIEECLPAGTALPVRRPRLLRFDVHSFEHHWQDEADAAYLYRILAAAEPDPRKQTFYSRLADVEDRHVVVWSRAAGEARTFPRRIRPAGAARLLARCRWFGPDFSCDVAGRGRTRGQSLPRRCIARRRACAPGGARRWSSPESADHATTLGEISGKGRSRGTGRRPADFCAMSCRFQ